MPREKQNYRAHDTGLSLADMSRTEHDCPFIGPSPAALLGHIRQIFLEFLDRIAMYNLPGKEIVHPDQTEK